MAAYVVIQAEVTDPEKFKKYQELAGPAVRRYGGKVLAAGGNFETLEGTWPRPTLVMLEFDSVEKAKDWYDSPEYQDAIVARQGAAVFDLVTIEGR